MDLGASSGSRSELVERVKRALLSAMMDHGVNDNTYIAEEDADYMARAAIAAIIAFREHSRGGK